MRPSFCVNISVHISVTFCPSVLVSVNVFLSVLPCYSQKASFCPYISVHLSISTYLAVRPCVCQNDPVRSSMCPCLSVSSSMCPYGCFSPSFHVSFRIILSERPMSVISMLLSVRPCVRVSIIFQSVRICVYKYTSVCTCVFQYTSVFLSVHVSFSILLSVLPCVCEYNMSVRLSVRPCQFICPSVYFCLDKIAIFLLYFLNRNANMHIYVM